MASIKEAYDSTMKESFTSIKIFLWAVPVAYVIFQLKNIKCDTVADFLYSYWLVIFISFFLLGFVVTLARNVVAKAQYVVPGINILEIFKNGILGLVAVIPYGFLGAALESACAQITLPGEILDPTFHILVHMFAASLPISGLCLLIRRMNILDAYNLKKYLYGFFLVFLDYSFFGIRLALLLMVVYLFFAYLFSLYIGFDNTFWTYIVSIGVMVVVILYANAIAQISDDIYTFPEKEELKLREEALINNVIAEQKNIKDER